MFLSKHAVNAERNIILDIIKLLPSKNDLLYGKVSSLQMVQKFACEHTSFKNPIGVCSLSLGDAEAVSFFDNNYKENMLSILIIIWTGA